MLPEDSSLPTDNQSLPTGNLPPMAANPPSAIERALPVVEIAANSGALAAPYSPYTSPAPEPAAALPTSVVAARRPRVWPVFALFFIAFIVGQIVSVVVLVAVAVLMYGLPAITNDPGGAILGAIDSVLGLLAAGLAMQIVMGSAALGAALLSPIGWRRRLRLKPAHISYGALAVSVIGLLALSNALSSLLGLGFLPESPVLQLLSDAMQSLDSSTLPLALLIVGIMPGIFEELLFRGYIQTRLSQRWGRHWGVGTAAVLFGIMHFDPVHSVLACLLGLYLGYLTERVGSIRPAMLCHAANNTIGVLVTYFGLEASGQVVSLIGLGLFTAILLAAISWLRRVLPYPAAAPPESTAPIDHAVPIEPPVTPLEQPVVTVELAASETPPTA